jgi:hypothetical protein
MQFGHSTPLIIQVDNKPQMLLVASGMLCVPGCSSLSIEECHNILPCERTSISLTQPDMKISLIRLLSKTHETGDIG